MEGTFLKHPVIEDSLKRAKLKLVPNSLNFDSNSKFVVIHTIDLVKGRRKISISTRRIGKE